MLARPQFLEDRAEKTAVMRRPDSGYRPLHKRLYSTEGNGFGITGWGYEKHFGRVTPSTRSYQDTSERSVPLRARPAQTSSGSIRRISMTHRASALSPAEWPSPSITADLETLSTNTQLNMSVASITF